MKKWRGCSDPFLKESLSRVEVRRSKPVWGSRTLIIERSRLRSASSRLSDKVLDLQHAVDNLIRRLRRGGRPAVAQRRFLIVQIDGLSRSVLDHALASGHMPFVKRLLRRHGFHLQPMSVGLPTSTPAFQMAAMYGVRPDIPGFHYFDRQRQTDIHFPRPDTRRRSRRNWRRAGAAF